MRRSRSSDQQIALALQQAQHGAPVEEVCRKLGISEQTFCQWRKKFGEMSPACGWVGAAKIEPAIDERRAPRQEGPSDWSPLPLSSRGGAPGRVLT